MKDKILTYLRSQPGQPFSGQELAARLGISRTAIWKHINNLKEEGYQITSRPGVGYQFRGGPDLLLPAELAPLLQGGQLGGQIDYHEEIGSTNDRAKMLADGGAPEGTVVIAEQQTAGKGRLGRRWFSPAGGGIYVSVILRPPLKPEEASGFTLLAAVALAQTVQQQTGIKAGIKWPNDLLLAGRKVGGILTEMKAEIDCIHYLVVGTGINVAAPAAEWAPDLLERAIFLEQVSGTTISRVRLLAGYLSNMEKLYGLYLEQGLAPILAEWKKRNITLGRLLSLSAGGQLFFGRAVDLDDSGALIMEDSDGKRQIFRSGEVTLQINEGHLRV